MALVASKVAISTSVHSSGQLLKQHHRCRCHERGAKAHQEALSLRRRGVELVAEDGVGSGEGSDGDEVNDSILEHYPLIGRDCGACAAQVDALSLRRYLPSRPLRWQSQRQRR